MARLALVRLSLTEHRSPLPPSFLGSIHEQPLNDRSLQTTIAETWSNPQHAESPPSRSLSARQLDMANNLFGRLAPSSRDTRSFYEELRAHDDDDDADADLEAGTALNVDEENLREQFNDFDAEGFTASDSRITVGSAAYGVSQLGKATRQHHGRREPSSGWPVHDDDADNDVPASLLVEPNEAEAVRAPRRERTSRHSQPRHPHAAGSSSGRSQAQWEAATTQQRLHQDDSNGRPSALHPRSLMAGIVPGGRREKSLWRWVNTSNLDSFMRDVYDYYEGGGLICILCSNALWLLSVEPWLSCARRPKTSLADKQ